MVLRGFRAREVLFPVVGDDHVGANAPLTIAGEAPPSPERDVHDSQVRTLVDGFLATLAAGDQRIVELRFRQGMSQRDAADELGIGRQSIRTRELKLRKLLLAYLQERGESELVPGALAVLLGAELASTLVRSWS